MSKNLGVTLLFPPPPTQLRLNILTHVLCRKRKQQKLVENPALQDRTPGESEDRKTAHMSPPAGAAETIDAPEVLRNVINEIWGECLAPTSSHYDFGLYLKHISASGNFAKPTPFLVLAI